jgi:hypothetical protein
MARTFNGSSAYISAPNAIGAIGNDSRTFACWMRSSSIATRQALCYEGLSNANQIWLWEIEASKISLNCGSGGFLQSATVLSSDTWYHMAVRYAGGSAQLFINGAQDATGGGFNLATASNEFSIGRYFQTPTTFFLFTGQIAEFAKYATNLSDADIAALGKGASPMKVRPQVLSFYAPLIRDVIDLKGTALTDNGPTTAADHPRIYR